MKKFFLTYAVFSVLFLTYLADASAGSSFDPGLDWNTLETENFYIHYPQQLEDVAQKLAGIAEQAHNLLSPEMEWEPFFKTQVVLTDTYDDANGYSSTSYYGRIVLYVVPPSGESSLADYDDWLRLLFVHEYTHLLHRDQHKFPFSTLRWLFGNFGYSSPNLFLPRWMAEAYAIRNETKFSTGGRLRSTYVDMYLREDVLSNNFHALGDGHDGLTEWPGGNYSYYYGSWFTNFYEQENGLGSWQEYNNCWSTGICLVALPCNGLSMLSWAKTGSTLGYHYSRWHQWLIERYSRQMGFIRSNPLTRPEEITASGFNTTRPRFDYSGLLAYSESEPYRHSRLVLLDENNRAREGIETVGLGSFGFFPDGQIMLSQLELHDQYYIYNDLWQYDPSTEELRQITFGERLSDPDVSSDGTMIVATRTGPLTRRLVLLDAKGDFIRDITEEDPDFICEAGEFSPDDKSVVGSCMEQGGKRDIFIIDLQYGERRRLTDDRYQDISPTWTPDGRQVVFVSDRTGIYNLWIYDLETESLSRLTNMRGGAFWPDISPDGQSVAFTYYTSSGFDIGVIDFRPEEVITDDQLLPDRESKIYEYDEVEQSVSSYTPLTSVYPRYWMPYVNAAPAFFYFLYGGTGTVSSYGITTSGYDALEMHSFGLYLAKDTNFGKLNYSLGYSNAMFDPIIQVSVAETVASAGSYIDLSEPIEKDRYKIAYERVFNATFDIYRAYQKMERTFILGFNYNLTRIKPMTIFPEYFPQRETGIFTGPGLYAGFSNTTQVGYGISQTDGRVIMLRYSEFNKVLGSDYNWSLLSGDYSEYIDLSHRMVLLFSLTGGINFGERLERGAFSLGGVSPEVGANNGYQLRGYFPGQFEGEHFLRFTSEFRFPIWSPEVGYGTWPYFLREFYGKFYNDLGSVPDEDQDESITDYETWRGGAGAELVTNFTFLYYFPIGFRIGYARGYSGDGYNIFYVLINQDI
jgi:WD40-like Beta Propeller Repeat